MVSGGTLQIHFVQIFDFPPQVNLVDGADRQEFLEIEGAVVFAYAFPFFIGERPVLVRVEMYGPVDFDDLQYRWSADDDTDESQ